MPHEERSVVTLEPLEQGRHETAHVGRQRRHADLVVRGPVPGDVDGKTEVERQGTAAEGVEHDVTLGRRQAVFGAEAHEVCITGQAMWYITIPLLRLF